MVGTLNCVLLLAMDYVASLLFISLMLWNVPVRVVHCFLSPAVLTFEIISPMIAAISSKVYRARNTLRMTKKNVITVVVYSINSCQMQL